MALNERMSDLLEPLRSAAAIRTNAAKLAFGPDGFVKSTDPKMSWKQQQAAAEKRRTDKEEAARGARSAQPAGSSGAAADGGTGASRPEVDVSASDVLYVLDGEPHASRSRVVQWWQCNNAPLVRYARQSARLFPPPPAQQSGGS